MVTYNGSNGNDNITGSQGDDQISGGYGDDTLNGDAGVDVIYGEARITPNTNFGSDSGATHTTTFTNNTTDTVYVYSTAKTGRVDLVYSLDPGESRTEDLYETSTRVLGNVDGSSFYSFLKTNTELPTTVTINSSNDTIDGGDGDDHIHGQLGADVIDGGAGNDFITGETGEDTISGGVGDDTISSGDDKDIVDGGEGNDTISGGNDDDRLTGGAGIDTIDGGSGQDTVFGGDDADIINGGGNDDTLHGDAGDDTIEGSLGDDSAHGGDGNDQVLGGTGLDTLYGDAGDDIIEGGSGDDIIFGGDDQDELYGDEGSDTISGDAGEDLIEGGTGADTLFGGVGNDTIFGNSATDSSLSEGDLIIESTTVTENDVRMTNIDTGAQHHGTDFATFEVNGQPFVISVLRAYDGYFDIHKVNDDGTLTTTDSMRYQNGNPSSEVSVTTTSGGDITSQISGSLAVFGNALQETRTIEIDGTTHLFVVSRNGGGITDWTVSDSGELTFANSMTFSADPGLVGDITFYEGADGTTYIYATRMANSTISRVEYDPATGFTEDTDFRINTSSRQTGAEHYTIGGTDYLAVSNGEGFDVYKIDPATGDLNLDQSLTVVSDDSQITLRNDVNHYVAEDGSVFLVYSNHNMDEVVLFKVDSSSAEVIETDRLSGNGDFYGFDSTSYSYIEGQPVIVVPDVAGGTTRLFTISDDGTFELKTEISDLPGGSVPNEIVQTQDGTYYVVDGSSGTTAKLEVQTPTGIDDDIIDGGDGDDMLYGQAGNDAITVGVGDIAEGGDDRDSFVVDKDQLGTGTTFTIDGGTGSTAAGDVDDFDTITFGEGLSIVPSTFLATPDEDISGPGASLSGTLQVTDGTTTYTINFTEIEEVICFVRGTMIQTDQGEVAVEDLSKGDRILTKDNGYKPIDWISSKSLSKATLESNPELYPVRIRAGALGANYPAQDLIVSAQHRILVKSKIAKRMFGTDEVLIAAKNLMLVEGIDFVRDCDEVEYFHFLFDQHEIVFANGLEAESLFTGPEAMKAVSPEAHGEILALFPAILDQESRNEGIRFIPMGRKGRKLAYRHFAKDMPLYSN